MANKTQKQRSRTRSRLVSIILSLANLLTPGCSKQEDNISIGGEQARYMGSEVIKIGQTDFGSDFFDAREKGIGVRLYKGLKPHPLYNWSWAFDYNRDGRIDEVQGNILADPEITKQLDFSEGHRYDSREIERFIERPIVPYLKKRIIESKRNSIKNSVF